jgi:Flp pilus assembly pilin Flp
LRGVIAAAAGMAGIVEWRLLPMLSLYAPLLLRLKNRFRDETGQDLVEYALIVALLSCCAILVEKDVAVSISGAYMNLANTFAADL